MPATTAPDGCPATSLDSSAAPASSALSGRFQAGATYGPRPLLKHQKATICTYGLLHALWRPLAARAERPRNGSMSEKSCPEGLPWVSVDDAKGFRALNPTTSLFCRWAASRCLPRCWFAIRDHRWRSLTQQHLRMCPDRHCRTVVWALPNRTNATTRGSGQAALSLIISTQRYVHVLDPDT